MTVQVECLKEILQNKQAELTNVIRSHSSQMILCEGENELIDRVQAMNRREEAVILLNTLTRTLEEVHAALDTVRVGSYGTCVECGGPIAARRIEAIPWALHCIRCQEVLDRRARIRAAVPGWDEAA